jgi:hypothetical protein
MLPPTLTTRQEVPDIVAGTRDRLGSAGASPHAATATRTTRRAASNRDGITRRGRIRRGSGSGGSLDDDRRSTRGHPIDGFVAQGVGQRVLGARNVRRGPSVHPAQESAGLLPERNELRVLDPPATRQLLDDQLGVEQQVDLAGAQLTGEGERPNDRGVFRDVVRLDTEELGDRGVGAGSRVAGVGARRVDERGPGRGWSGVAACGPVGPDDQAERACAGCPRRR